MKKANLFNLLLLSITISTPVEAVEVGDIYYDDKSFSAELDLTKRPIGLVYWVGNSKDYGYIMQLDQNTSTLNYYYANQYCNTYYTASTKAGDWRIPDRIELIRMGTEQWNGVKNNKFNDLNTKLASIKSNTEQIGRQLYSDSYYWSASYYGQTFYLNTDGVIDKQNNSNQGDTSNLAYVRCIMAF